MAASLTNAQRRFERQRLQIGVLGRAGQGKSTLLQQLSGLKGDVIPSGHKGHCTGARSLIVHEPQGTEPHARIHFYSPDHFLHEVIRPYFAYFGANAIASIGVVPESLDEFADAKLDQPQIQQQGGDPAAKLRHLQRYQQDLPRYKALLGSASKRVEHSEIRSYVAQEDSAGLPLAAFKAVALAEIFCHFPRTDIANLSLADMPGLGDTGVGQEEQLIRALAEDTDLALLIKLPDGQRQVWQDYDVQLYAMASKCWASLAHSRLDVAGAQSHPEQRRPLP